MKLGLNPEESILREKRMYSRWGEVTPAESLRQESERQILGMGKWASWLGVPVEMGKGSRQQMWCVGYRL